MTRELLDESAQVGNLYAEVQVFFQDALKEGYDHHAISEALMHGARDVLADSEEFLAVLQRFLVQRRMIVDWLPKEQFEAEGAEVIGWLSSDKGFQDVTARLIFMRGAWHWGESEEPVKRPDLIRGCIPWPEPPTAADGSDVEAAISGLEELRAGTTLGGLSWKALRDKGRR